MRKPHDRPTDEKENDRYLKRPSTIAGGLWQPLTSHETFIFFHVARLAEATPAPLGHVGPEIGISQTLPRLAKMHEVPRQN